ENRDFYLNSIGTKAPAMPNSAAATRVAPCPMKICSMAPPKMAPMMAPMIVSVFRNGFSSVSFFTGSAIYDSPLTCFFDLRRRRPSKQGMGNSHQSQLRVSNLVSFANFGVSRSADVGLTLLIFADASVCHENFPFRRAKMSRRTYARVEYSNRS